MIRRPAAKGAAKAKAAGKAKAKAKGAPAPKVGARRRRPAAAVPSLPLTVEEKYDQGKVLTSAEATPALFRRGDWVRAVEASYFETECLFAGLVERVVLESGDVELELTLTGTSSEELLKIASAALPFTLRAYLCHRGCDEKRVNPNLAHLKKFRKVLREEGKTWEDNLKEGDENRDLRRRQEDWERQFS